MNNLIYARIDDKLFELVNEFAKEKHWKTSQTIREIVAQFFNYKLSDDIG